MWSVQEPEFDAGETFMTCIERVRNRTMKLSLEAIRPEIEAAAVDYRQKAENTELHTIPQIDTIGAVPGSEMILTYNSRMAKKGQPGRHIYDQIKLLPDDDRCPFCDHRNVSTIDHVLPKQLYPFFAVTPINLVGCCSDCNKMKLDVAPTTASDTVLHPYFDDVVNEQWLAAEIVEGAPPAVTFHVVEVDNWDDILNERIAHQFDLLQLAKLYSSQAAREIVDIRHNLQRHYDSGGAAAVRTELEFQWRSRRANRINSWQTATYEALATSDWFCDGGFSSV